MEHARVQRIADRWRNEPVEVEHYVQDIIGPFGNAPVFFRI